MRYRAADLRRAGAQRRRDQELCRQPRRAAAAGRGWAEDRRLAAAVERLPERLASAGDLDWSAAIDPIAAASSLIVIGRGPTLAIAREAALKLKEVANLHAEAFSGAEFLHGPVALVGARYPILALMPTDAAGEGMRALVRDLGGKGAAVFAAAPGRRAAGARSRPSRNRRGLPDPGLLCDDACGWRRGSTSTRTGRAICRRSRGPDDADGHSRRAVAADFVFDGAALHRDHAVVIDGADIAALCRAASCRWAFRCARCRRGHGWPRALSTCRSMAAATCCSTTARPPTASLAIAAAHRRFGTTGLLPTLISDTPEKMRRASDAVAAAMRRLPRRARHPFRGAVPVARARRRARSGDVPRARRCRSRRC